MVGGIVVRMTNFVRVLIRCLGLCGILMVRHVGLFAAIRADNILARPFGRPHEFGMTMITRENNVGHVWLLHFLLQDQSDPLGGTAGTE